MNGATSAVALDHRAGFRSVNDFARETGWLHGPVVAYASYGVVFFGVLLVAGFLLARARRDPLLVARSVLAGAGVLLAVAVNQPIVHAVAERRPYDQIAGVLVLVHRSADASFPSDHATMAGAAAAGLLLVDRRLGIAAAVAAALMALARVTSARTSRSTSSPDCSSAPSSPCSPNSVARLWPGWSAGSRPHPSGRFSLRAEHAGRPSRPVSSTRGRRSR